MTDRRGKIREDKRWILKLNMLINIASRNYDKRLVDEILKLIDENMERSHENYE